MSFEEQLPEWNAEGTEPPTQKKNDGWQPEEKPPAGWWNWLLNRTFAAFQEIRSVITAHLSDYTLQIPYELTAGAVNTYAVTLTPAPESYVEGMALAIKIHVDNTGASVININALGAKTIKKPNGNDVSAGNLKAGSIYTLRYNGVNFILQGSDAAGDATPGNVLAGKTFSNDEGEQTGTMTNRGAHNITPGVSSTTIPVGYHNGSGQVASLGGDAAAANVLSGKSFSSDIAGRAAAGSMPNRTGHVTAQGSSYIDTTLRFIPQPGYYPGDAENSVQISDASWVAENIKPGVMIFGKMGSFSPIKSIQRGEATITTSDAIVVPINSVDSSKSIILVDVRGDVLNSALLVVSAFSAVHPNTEIVLSWRGTHNPAPIIVWQVIEFEDVVSVQYGWNAWSSSDYQWDRTISSVNLAKTFVIVQNKVDSLPTLLEDMKNYAVTGLLINSTTLRLRREVAGVGTYPETHYYVVEFP